MIPRTLGVVLSKDEWLWLEEHRKPGQSLSSFVRQIVRERIETKETAK